MRALRYEDVTKIVKATDARVNDVITRYNEKEENKTIQAVKGGTRRPRDKEEQRVLDAFKLKS